MAVEVNGGPPPALAASAVNDHEAREPGLLEEEGVSDLGLEGLNV